MITKVVFKGINDRGNIIYRTIPIKHNFEIIPEQKYQGLKLPETSIERQVFEYLDNVDKSDLMLKHGFSIILDYYLPKKKKTKQEELEEFLKYLNNIITIDKSVEAIIYEHKDILFGKDKSNITKTKEVLSILKISYKTIANTMRYVTKMFTNKKYLE